MLDITDIFERFEKRAGLVKVPEKLIMQIWRWSAKNYASRVWYLLEKEVKRLKRNDHYKKIFDEDLGELEKFEKSLYNDSNPINSNLDKDFYFSAPDGWVSIRFIKDNDKFAISINENLSGELAKNLQLVNNVVRFETEDEANKYIYNNLIPYLGEILDAFTNNIYDLDSFSKYTNEKIVNYGQVLNKIKKLTDEPKDNDETEYLDIELKEDFFRENLSKKDYDKYIKDNNIWMTLHVLQVFNALAVEKEKGEGNWSGLWHGFYDTIVLNSYVTTDGKSNDFIKIISNFEKDIIDLRITIRHELQHFMQTIIKRINSLREEGGLPSKKIRVPGFDPRGLSLMEDRDDPDTYRQEHALRDIEFYARLSDEVDRFNLIGVSYPEELKREYAKAWVGLPNNFLNMRVTKETGYPEGSWQFGNRMSFYRGYGRGEISTFFKALKERAQEKYKKAVKEFFKAIDV